MSRLSVPNVESDNGPSGQVYAQIKKAIGSVPNTFAAIAAHGPAALKSILFADATLASGSLSKRDQEVIKLVISGVAGCDYCVAAHNHLARLAGLKPDVLKQIRNGQPSGDDKRDALVGFVRKLAQSSGTVSDAGFRRDQGGRLQRRATGRDQPRLRDHRLHQRLQPHQRHRDRFSRRRVKRPRRILHEG
ncbi:AhpD family alkylhydroperoxidase [Bradyrhizobium sp. LB9.1b]